MEYRCGGLIMSTHGKLAQDMRHGGKLGNCTTHGKLAQTDAGWGAVRNYTRHAGAR